MGIVWAGGRGKKEKENNNIINMLRVILREGSCGNRNWLRDGTRLWTILESEEFWLDAGNRGVFEWKSPKMKVVFKFIQLHCV